jgi:hypothetical protein
VYAPELTREAVFTALEDGRLFASSDHGRPLLRFAVNGTAVGYAAEVELEPQGGGALPAPRRIEVFLAQDGSPAAAKNRSAADSVAPGWRPDWSVSIEIIKNGDLLASLPVDRPVSRVEYVERSDLAGATYGRESCVEVQGRWYINPYSDNPVDPDELDTGGADFYLVRVVGANGRCAYAGPIWVTPRLTPARSR